MFTKCFAKRASDAARKSPLDVYQMRITTTGWMAIVAVVVALLLGTGSGQAADVIFDPADSDKVIGIENLDVGGTAYNVAFTTSTTASQVYGDFPGLFDFSTSETAEAAVDAVNAELTTASAIGVGAEESPAGVPFYRVGFDSGMENDIEVAFFWEGLRGDGEDTTWAKPSMSDADSYNLGQRVWADFSVVPEPGTALLLGLGLAGLGLVARRRQNTA